MNALTNVAYFLVDTLITLYMILVVVRLLLGLTRADFYNPISQFIVTATNPVIVPLRRIIPPIGKIDTAALVVLIALAIAKTFLLYFIKGAALNLPAILFASILDLLVLSIYVLIFSIIIQAVMSWVNPATGPAQNPMLSVINSITRPVITPFSKVIPKIGLFDLSPLAALLFLNVLLILIRSI